MLRLECIKNNEYAFLVRPKDPGNGNTRIVMFEISEKEELMLNEGRSLLLRRGGLSFNVEPDNCLAYGELDLSPNSEHLRMICSGNWMYRFYVRQFIPSDYNYNEHAILADRKPIKWFDTANAEIYIPYLYGTINKPKRTVIFKEYIDILTLRKKEAANKRAAEYYSKHKHKINETAVKKRKKERLSKLKFKM